MTLRDLVESEGGIAIQGYRKIQCWETEDRPTVYHEGYDFFTLNDKYMDREVTYMFPYMVSPGEAAICIELTHEDVF